MKVAILTDIHGKCSQEFLVTTLNIFKRIEKENN